MSYYSVERGTSLTHTGVKGMKWYQRNYQTADGKWTPLGLQRRREREGFGDGKDGLFKVRRKTKIEKEEARKAKLAARTEKKQAKAAVKAEKKQAKAEAKQQKIEAKQQKVEAAKREDIDKAIAKGDYKYLSKHVDELSTNDLMEAQKRISTMNTMRKAYNEINPPKEPLYKRIDNYANTTYNVVKKFQEVTGLGPDKSDKKDSNKKKDRGKQEKESKQTTKENQQNSDLDNRLDRLEKANNDLINRLKNVKVDEIKKTGSPEARLKKYGDVKISDLNNDEYIDFLSTVADVYEKERNR